MHIAQFNIARLNHPLDDPRSAGFRDNLDRVNAAAKRMPGFVWVLEDSAGTATSFRIDDDPQMLINLSVWESVAALRRFVFGPVHGYFLERRSDWFTADARAQLVMWPVPIGARPTLEEGVRRLALLREKGAGLEAFDWRGAIAGA